MKTYRIGVIGLGQRIAHVLAAMKEVGWSLDVAAYVDPGPVGAPILSQAAIPLGVSYPSPGALLHDGPYDLVMIGTPFVAGMIGLNNPRTAMVFGGLMGTVSGVSAGLAATDRRLVPYGALTATFHTGFGCLVAPSIFYLIVRLIVGN